VIASSSCSASPNITDPDAKRKNRFSLIGAAVRPRTSVGVRARPYKPQKIFLIVALAPVTGERWFVRSDSGCTAAFSLAAALALRVALEPALDGVANFEITELAWCSWLVGEAPACPTWSNLSVARTLLTLGGGTCITAVRAFWRRPRARRT
jgi:hypothetical protein